MTDQKVPGAPAYQSEAPPPYSPVQQGVPYPNQQTPVMYTQQANYQTQPNAAIISQSLAQPGSTFRYRNGPALIVCQHCQATVTTRLTYETGLLTWAAAGLVFLFGGFLGCCLIPFCLDSCKDVRHTCPICNRLNGKYRRMS